MNASRRKPKTAGETCRAVLKPWVDLVRTQTTYPESAYEPTANFIKRTTRPAAEREAKAPTV